jgi:hypothetical protein
MALPFAGPAVAAKLKRELETSSDAGLVGATGELLIEEPASAARDTSTHLATRCNRREELNSSRDTR